MPDPSPNPPAEAPPHRLRHSPTLPGLVTALLVVVILYFGKPVLMPLALAALFAFLLGPLVNVLHRLRLPRALAVVLVTLSVFTVLGVLGWVIGREVASLAGSLPNYKDNIRSRIITFHRSGRGGVMEKLKDIQNTIQETNAAAQTTLDGKPPPGNEAPTPPNTAAEDSGETQNPAKEDSPPKPTVERPIPAVEPAPSSQWLNGVLGSAGEALGTAATVIVFVIFLLLRQQELRNRVMRLAGYRHVTTVTRTMDETAERVGRYLLMQALINGLYGLVLATGLYFIGLPYVVLWGVLAALFRFIPYVGPIVVAVLPAAVSLAVFPDWQHPLMVVALIAGLELCTNMILEPVLYGQSVGVSEFALLIAIVFWTWLWGGIGLVMATPLTVCFVVMARHIPSLEWVDILMGDNPNVKSYMILYQRLLAGDETEAGDFVAAEVKKKSPVEVLDETILPAIALAKRESSQDRLTETEARSIFDAIVHTVEEILPGDRTASPPPSTSPLPLLLGWPLDAAADETALRCLGPHLPAGLAFHMVPGLKLSAELHAEIESRQPCALLISATPPGSHETARLQVRRLSRQFPRLRILVGRWGVPDDLVKADPLLESGASGVYPTLAGAEKALTALLRENAAVSAPPGSPGPRMES